jgi:RNase P subunit RPR2
MFCHKCNKNTPHVEDTVVDPESATVWHCLICGDEQRPPGGNAYVLAG